MGQREEVNIDSLNGFCWSGVPSAEEQCVGMTELYKKNRVELLKAMHRIVASLNHEGAYYNSWIYLVPDCPSEEDFIDMAENDDIMDECAKLFVSLISSYGKYGICVSGDWDEHEYMNLGATDDEPEEEGV